MIRVVSRASIPSHRSYDYAKRQVALLGRDIEKLKIKWDAVRPFSASINIDPGDKQPCFPHIVFVKTRSETLLHMNTAVDVLPKNVHKNYSVLLRSREVLKELLPILWPYLPGKSSLKRPLGFVFDASSGFFAIKQNPDMSHLSTAESFSIFRAPSMDEDYCSFLKGIFAVHPNGRITSLSVTPLVNDPAKAEALACDKITLDAVLFQLGRRLKEDLELPDKLPVKDYTSPSPFKEILRSRGIDTLGDLQTKLNP